VHIDVTLLRQGGRVQLTAPSLLLSSGTATGGKLVASGNRASTAVGDQSVLDVRGDGDEGLLHIQVLLRGSLVEVNVVLFGQSLTLLVRDCPLVLAIALVADQNLIYVHVRVLKTTVGFVTFNSLILESI